MLLVPQMATALVFFIYMTNDGLSQASGDNYETGMSREQARMHLLNSGFNMNREVRICGPLLTTTLELFCEGLFHGVKKILDESKNTWENGDTDNFAVFPFRSKRSALEAFTGTDQFRRRARNVADECCFRKSCTLAELSTYCGNNRNKRQ